MAHGIGHVSLEDFRLSTLEFYGTGVPLLSSYLDLILLKICQDEFLLIASIASIASREYLRMLWNSGAIVSGPLCTIKPFQIQGYQWIEAILERKRQVAAVCPPAVLQAMLLQLGSYPVVTLCSFGSPILG